MIERSSLVIETSSLDLKRMGKAWYPNTDTSSKLQVVSQASADWDGIDAYLEPLPLLLVGMEGDCGHPEVLQQRRQPPSRTDCVHEDECAAWMTYLGQ